MEALFSESRSSFLELLSGLEKRILEGRGTVQRQHDKRIKQLEDDIRVLKEKLAKKDEIMHFHEEEINALRNQVKSLKSEKPLCPSCSQRDDSKRPAVPLGPGRKRHFSPDSSCGRSSSAAAAPSGAGGGTTCAGKRRRTGPRVLVPETCPPEEDADFTEETFDLAFRLEKTPEKKAQKAEPQLKKETPVKAEPSIRLGLNDLSPASATSQLDVTLGPVPNKPLEGPQLGDTVLGSESQEDTLLADSPPLVSLKGAAAVIAARRPSLPRSARMCGRQLKLHSLSFSKKVSLTRPLEKSNVKKPTSGAENFQDLEETILDSSVQAPSSRRAASVVRPPPRTRSGRDLPTLGGSPTGPFKKPLVPVSRPCPAKAPGETSSPENARRDSPTTCGSEPEVPSLDPIACSTLKTSSQSSGAFSLGSLDTEAPESAVFAAPTVRRPLSPLSNERAAKPEPPSRQLPPLPPGPRADPVFKFATAPERRKDERRQLPAFSCFECQEYYRGSGLSEEEIAVRMKNCSRHRAKHPPPSTPEGFWDIDLPATPTGHDDLPQVARKRRRKPYQFPKDEGK